MFTRLARLAEGWVADGSHQALVVLAERSAETDELLRPLLRLRKWAGHPLSIALFQSWR